MESSDVCSDSGLDAELVLQRSSLALIIRENIFAALGPIVAKAVEDALGCSELPHLVQEVKSKTSYLVDSVSSGGASVNSSVPSRKKPKKAASKSQHRGPQARPVGVKRLEATLGAKMLLDNLAHQCDEADDTWSIVPATPQASLHEAHSDGNSSLSPHPFGAATPTSFSRIGSAQSWTTAARRSIVLSQEHSVRSLVRAPRRRVHLGTTHAVWATFLKVIGVLPLRSIVSGEERVRSWNRYLALSFSVCVLIATCYALFTSHCPWCMSLLLARSMDVLLAGGSTVALVASWRLSQGFLGARDAILEQYADRERVGPPCCRISSRRLCSSLFLWAISCCSRLSRLSASGVTWIEVMSICCFSLMGLLFAGLSFSVFHVASSLQILVDAYCARFADDGSSTIPKLTVSMLEWNILVVVLRAASSRLEILFIALQTVAFGLVVLVAISTFVDGSSVDEILSVAPLVIIAMLSFFEVAGVTEKCKRVPAFVNALNSGRVEEDCDLHYLVEHVSYSGAGLEVFGVLVDTGMALKIFYLSFMSGLSILMRIVYKFLT